MTTKRKTVDFIVEQIENAGIVTARAMFGEYAIYCDAKLVALVCDDELYVKPTASGRAFVGSVRERSPYKGAKPYIWISGERWDEGTWLSDLVRVTTAELPTPNKKTRKKGSNP